MGNMSYCRFENTIHDLKECWEYWDDATSTDENKAKTRLLKLCKEIAEADCNNQK